MGLRRLRGRLDQVQGEANDTLGMAKDLIADLQDGFGVTVEVDADAAMRIIQGLLADNLSGTIKIPIVLKIDPTVDTKETT